MMWNTALASGYGHRAEEVFPPLRECDEALDDIMEIGDEDL